MSFAAIKTAYKNIKKKSNKFSSTLQKQKATDFCKIHKKYYSNTIDVFSDSKPYSKIFLGSHLNSLERTSLSTHLTGIITVEASVILPIYIFVIATILYLFNVLYIETIFQERLSEIARDISNSYYVSSSFANLSSEDKEKVSSSLNEPGIDLASSLINSFYISSIFADDKISNLIDSSYIVDKAAGISFLETTFDTEESKLSIVASYKISIPFMPSIIELPIKQCCKVNLFCGKHITNNPGNTDVYVYICSSGTVYHTNKYCSYLLKYTSVVPKENIPSLGTIPCLYCRSSNINAQNTNYVYLTQTGDCYHYSLDCPVFMRDVYKIKYTELSENFKLCTRCEENIQ